jgi:predicted nicotinamide N-methyase|tara:strand:+ start:12931 stop:13563 length:633 start_codon:yes stop_codon:yes gene_type:complete
MHLQTELEKRLPGAELMWQSPLEGIDLQLLASNSALLQLDAQQIGQYWQQLPYWAFAWAAGQGLAQHILLNPELVAGKRVLDFGCGSGIVGIAAAKAGAESVLCCDSDPLALLACQHNAARNGVDISVTSAWCGEVGQLDCLLAADILYDLTSSGDLSQQCQSIPEWLIAETEYQLPPWSELRKVAAYHATTQPVLEDFDDNLLVSIYQS